MSLGLQITSFLVWTLASLSTLFQFSANPGETPSQKMLALAFSLMFILIGIVGLTSSALIWRNARIQIDGTEMSSFDWLGRRLVHVGLSEVRVVEKQRYDGNGPAIRVGTDRGELRIGSTLQGHADLLDRLRRAITGDTMSAQAVEFSKLPPVRYATYGYRTPAVLLQTLVLWTFLLAATVAIVRDGKASIPLSAVPFLGIPLLFAAIGVGMILTAWNDRIVLDHERICWTDSLRRRVEAPIGEITTMEEIWQRGGGKFLQIATLRGTVQANPSLHGYDDLKSQIEVILAARHDASLAS